MTIIVIKVNLGAARPCVNAMPMSTYPSKRNLSEIAMTTTDESAPELGDDADQVAKTDATEEDTNEKHLPRDARPRDRRSTGATRRRTLLAVGIIAGLGALACSGVVGWQLWQRHLIDIAGRQAQGAAIATVEALTSIDSNNVDANFADIINRSTGEFKEMYTKSSTQLRQLVIDNKATAQGTVIDSAIQSQTATRVVVLLMVDQSITNAARTDPRIDKSRMKLTMAEVDGRWLASEVELP